VPVEWVVGGLKKKKKQAPPQITIDCNARHDD
jgi:hypothetical protein